ncbi:MAG: BMP family ABC transporter substrate-binding protein, partial [Oscillospiraceae bacterium]|nr:BMP family ABC transporter substrate-binding protein [Oscillospiraceae bacterium]
GYIANYPIFGSIAEVNAFAAGVKMTNPRAVIDLRWSCEDENALEQLLEKGVEVISNRVATNTKNPHWAMEWGTYITPHDGGAVIPLAVPCWNWGNFYCQIAENVLAGVKDTASEGGKAVNYWWGLDSGIIDIQLSDEIPAGVKMLAEGLKRAIISGSLDPFGMRLADTLGNLRNDGTQHFTPEELMNMDWLCDNIKGGIPSYEKLLPEARELVRLMGIYRDELAPGMGEEKPS